MGKCSPASQWWNGCGMKKSKSMQKRLVEEQGCRGGVVAGAYQVLPLRALSARCRLFSASHTSRLFLFLDSLFHQHPFLHHHSPRSSRSPIVHYSAASQNLDSPALVDITPASNNDTAVAGSIFSGSFCHVAGHLDPRYQLHKSLIMIILP